VSGMHGHTTPDCGCRQMILKALLSTSQGAGKLGGGVLECCHSRRLVVREVSWASLSCRLDILEKLRTFGTF
jgi:hypothetical protein